MCHDATLVSLLDLPCAYELCRNDRSRDEVVGEAGLDCMYLACPSRKVAFELERSLEDGKFGHPSPRS